MKHNVVESFINEIDLDSCLIVDGNKILQHDRSRLQLPNEMITLIISHFSHDRRRLCECTLVSKQFHDVANAFLWRAPTFNDEFLHRLAGTSPMRLAMIGQHIRELNVSGTYWSDTHLLRLFPHLSKLTHLSVYQGTCITDAAFQRMPLNVAQNLTFLRLNNTDLTEASFSAIGQYCHQLCELDWTISATQSSQWLEKMLTSCCSLKRLMIKASFNKSIDEKTVAVIKTFDQLTLVHINQQTPAHLKSLLLPTTITTTPGSSTLAAATTTIRRIDWPHLTHLWLFDCSDIDDHTLIDFIKAHPHLQDLHLANGVHLTDISVNAIEEYLPALKSVALTGSSNISSDRRQRLACRFSRWVDIDLDDDTSISSLF